jgi:hypothetical protein
VGGFKGGKKSHASDPDKPNGVQFMPKKQRDSMSDSDRGKKSHTADSDKPNGVHFIPKEQHDSMSDSDTCKMGGGTRKSVPGKNNTEWYVLEAMHSSQVSVRARVCVSGEDIMSGTC